MQFKHVVIRDSYFLVSEDLEIREDDYFITIGFGAGGYGLEVQRCKKILEDEEEIMSQEQDLADSFGGGYFLFPLKKSSKVIASNVEPNSLAHLTEDEIKSMSNGSIKLEDLINMPL